MISFNFESFCKQELLAKVGVSLDNSRQSYQYMPPKERNHFALMMSDEGLMTTYNLVNPGVTFKVKQCEIVHILVFSLDSSVRCCAMLHYSRFTGTTPSRTQSQLRTLFMQPLPLPSCTAWHLTAVA